MFTRHFSSLHASRMQHSRWEKLRKLVHQRWGEKIWHPSDNEQGGKKELFEDELVRLQIQHVLLRCPPWSRTAQEGMPG